MNLTLSQRLIDSKAQLSKRDLSNAPPHLAELWRLIIASPYTLAELCDIAGYSPRTIQKWYQDHNPSMFAFQSFLAALGYELVIQKKPE